MIPLVLALVLSEPKTLVNFRSFGVVIQDNDGNQATRLVTSFDDNGEGRHLLFHESGARTVCAELHQDGRGEAMNIRRRNPADGAHGLPCDECGRKWTVHASVGSHLILLCDKHAAALSEGVEEAVAAKLDEVDLHPGHPTCPVCGKKREQDEQITMLSPGGDVWSCEHGVPTAEPALEVPADAG